jgi:hypothetical protein
MSRLFPPDLPPISAFDEKTPLKRITRTHAIIIPLPVASAFPLFTPTGEMDWIPGWRPTFIHPADGTMEEGMVFTTGEGTEETFWSCIEWAPETHRVRYARVTPSSRFVHVAVEGVALGPDSTRIEVRYEMTALTATGEALLDRTTPEAFSATIEGWKTLLDQHIAKG